jgi:hypothetical protein
MFAAELLIAWACSRMPAVSPYTPVAEERHHVDALGPGRHRHQRDGTVQELANVEGGVLEFRFRGSISDRSGMSLMMTSSVSPRAIAFS